MGIGKSNDKNVHFGGVNVLIFGDHHQMGPIGDRPLYMPRGSSKNANSADAELGHEIYRQFTSAVELCMQMRVTDPVWQGTLSRMRNASCKCNPEDIALIRGAVIKACNLTCVCVTC